MSRSRSLFRCGNGMRIGRWGLALLAPAIAALVFLGLWISSLRRPAGPGTDAPAVVLPSPPQNIVAADRSQEPGETLRKAVEHYLKQSTPNPAGVEACIDLGVFYLNQNRLPEAEALFKRMDEYQTPSAYHFVGRLGLAVTDALNSHYRASHAKFTELFDPKRHDNRVQILNDYVTKNPEFAKWVNEADSHNSRNGIAGSSALPQGLRHFPTRPSFKKPGK